MMASWMVDGKPGKVLAAMAAAQTSVDRVGKRRGDKMTFQAADEVILAATQAIAIAGAVYVVTLSPPRLETFDMVAKDKRMSFKAVHMVVDALLQIVHPEDGSSLSFSASATALCTMMGKYSGAANTGARKQVWLSALGITSGETDAQHKPADPPEETPEEVEFLYACIDACESSDELRALGKLPEAQTIRGKWRVRVRQQIQARNRDLKQMGDAPARTRTPGMIDPSEFSVRRGR